MTRERGEAMPLPAELEGAIARYNTWIDGELEKEQDANKIGVTLYHYTNVAGLEGIIKSEAVWFTDFRHMNDPSEITHGIELCRDVIRLRKPGTDGRVQLFLDCLADFMRLENFSRALEYFIGSFSRTGDDLGQWRAYADNGRGVVIGFAPHLFRIENTSDKKPNEVAFVSPIMYDLAAASHRHDTAIEQAERFFGRSKCPRRFAGRPGNWNSFHARVGKGGDCIAVDLELSNLEASCVFTRERSAANHHWSAQ